jgi:hypothetical protein
MLIYNSTGSGFGESVMFLVAVIVLTVFLLGSFDDSESDK